MIDLPDMNNPKFKDTVKLLQRACIVGMAEVRADVDELLGDSPPAYDLALHGALRELALATLAQLAPSDAAFMATVREMVPSDTVQRLRYRKVRERQPELQV